MLLSGKHPPCSVQIPNSDLSFPREGIGRAVSINSGFGWAANGSLLGSSVGYIFVISLSAPLTSDQKASPGRCKTTLCLALPNLTREAGWPPSVQESRGPARVGMNSGIETRGL